MPLNANGRNAMLSGGLGDAIGLLSLHTGDPGTTGANEVSGGSYARKTVTWGSASGGTRSNSAAVTFDVPGSTTVFYVGFWNSGGTTFYGWAPLSGTPKGFGTAQASNDTITSYGHGLSNGDRVVVSAVNAESLPAGLSEGVAYYVVGATADTFQLSTTSGGTAVDITSTGELAFQRVVPESFGSAGQLTFQSGQLTLDATMV